MFRGVYICVDVTENTANNVSFRKEDRSMSDKKSTEIPIISALDPDTVSQGWEGVMKVYGSGFDKGSFVLIDGLGPRVTRQSSSLIEVQLNTDITGSVGDKVVKVHTNAGDVSEGKVLRVKRQTSRAIKR
jgi:hypothetical protein